jgi:hypothetical protein
MNEEGRPPGGPPHQHNTGVSSLQAGVAVPWWTEADQAELDVLVHAFVYGYVDHRERCSLCASGPWCENVKVAFDALVGWLVFRYRLSKAEWLRRDFDELAALLGEAA